MESQSTASKRQRTQFAFVANVHRLFLITGMRRMLTDSFFAAGDAAIAALYRSPYSASSFPPESRAIAFQRRGSPASFVSIPEGTPSNSAGIPAGLRGIRGNPHISVSVQQLSKLRRCGYDGDLIQLTTTCGLRGCKNRPAPFPGRISKKATKPGSVCPVSYRIFFLSVSIVLLTITTFCVVLFYVIFVFCRLVVLVRSSVPVQVIDWKDLSPK